MSPRPYRSPQRAASSSRTRAKLLEAAYLILGTPGGNFSLEAVANKAGVTRLTVYNQFGSRRALLEAVFDDVAAKRGLFDLPAAITDPDPHAGLARLIEVFCNLWSSDQNTVACLYGASQSDPELAESLRERNERRRGALAALVSRMGKSDTIDEEAGADLVDVLFALTSFAFYKELTAKGRSRDAACALIKAMAEDAVRRAGTQSAEVGIGSALHRTRNQGL